MVKVLCDHALGDQRDIESGGSLHCLQAALFGDEKFRFTLQGEEVVLAHLLGVKRNNHGLQLVLWGMGLSHFNQTGLWLAHYEITPYGDCNRGTFYRNAQPELVMNQGQPGYRIMSGPDRLGLMTAFMSGDHITLSYFDQGHEEKISWQVTSVEKYLGMIQWFLIARDEPNDPDPPLLALYNPDLRTGTYYPSFRPGS